MSLPLLAGKRLEFEGRRDDALKMYMLVLRMGAHLGQDPFGCNSFSAVLCDVRGLRAIEKWLWSGPMDEETVAAVQKQVHALSEGRPRWEPLIAGELIMFDEMVERLQQEPEVLGNYVVEGRGALAQARRRLLRTKIGQELLVSDSRWLREQLVQRFALPLHEYLRTHRDFEMAAGQQMVPLSPGWLMLDRSDRRAVRSYYGTDELYWTAFDVQCGLLRYRAANGRFPDKLAELEPFILSPATDPFTNEPLKYRLEADGLCRFWSVGDNLKDESGVRPEDPKRSKSDDIVWNSPAIRGRD